MYKTWKIFTLVGIAVLVGRSAVSSYSYTDCAAEEMKKVNELLQKIVRLERKDKRTMTADALQIYVKINLERKAEISAERDKQMQINAGLQYTLDKYSETTEWLECAWFLKYRMEIYRSGSNAIGRTKFLNLPYSRVIKIAQEAIHIRQTMLEKIVNQLMELSSQYYEGITTRWTALFKQSYTDLQKVPFPQDQLVFDLPERPNLTSLVMNLRATSDVREAIEVFKHGCRKRFWDEFQQDYFSGKNNDIKIMANALTKEERDVIIGRMKKLINSFTIYSEEPMMKYKDIDFVINLIEHSSYFLTENPQYLVCAEVTYYPTYGDMYRLKEFFVEHYVGLEFAAQVDKFCNSFVSFYDIVISAALHGGLRPVNLECKLNSMQIYRHLKDVLCLGDSSSMIDEYVFLCKVFGGFQFNFVIPKTDNTDKREKLI